MLTIIDEYSRFPFVFPCADMTSSTIIKCLCQLFAIFGMPAYIHSDQGSSFMSHELKSFLYSQGIATSRTSGYNPQGNGQVERYNGIIWKTIMLALKSKCLKITEWEIVLPDALHSIRSLLCTAINATPHERLFSYNRRSVSGTSVPTWLSSPGTVFMKRHIRQSKYDPLVDEVELLEANPDYAHVRLPDGKETTVSVHHLAPKSNTPFSKNEKLISQPLDKTTELDFHTSPSTEVAQEETIPESTSEEITMAQEEAIPETNPEDVTPRRSRRDKQPPKYLSDYCQF